MAMVLFLSLFFSVQMAAGAQEPSSYVGQQERSVKALSDSEIQGYLEGEGMGLAKAAELNGYPGPKHVLELAESLGLNETQRTVAEKLFQNVQTKARDVGLQIVELEREMDVLFATAQADEQSVEELTSRIGLLQGRLRAIHLAAHLAMKQALAPVQLALYQQLRGYDAAPLHESSHHH